MKYDPIMCMNVPDSVKTKDAGGFSQGSKAKIVTENAGTQYESFTVEYGGSPLKRGFKSREAAAKYAKNQGLTVDEKTIDKAIKACDEEQFYQIRFGSGKIEGIKGNIDFVKQYVKDLMKKYGEKSAFVSQKGKPIFSYIK